MVHLLFVSLMYISFSNLYLAEGKTFHPTFEKYIAFVGIFLNFNNFFRRYHSMENLD